nr:receptor-like protein 35 [Oryza sativa Japonica Group]
MLLILLIQVQSRSTLADGTSSSASAQPAPCLPGQAWALLRLKNSFDATAGDYSAAFRSWIAGTDCCRWEGIRCGGAQGRAVTSLDLGYRWLRSPGLDDALFSLTSLEYLDISWNDFSASKLPATGFEKLAELTHLDLCSTNFAGRVPVGIGRLKSLAYLDLSTTFFEDELDDENNVIYYYSDTISQLSEPSLETLLANLTNLEELRLGMVNMSRNGARWCDAMARSSPKLRVISMPYCSLSGPICHSLSALRSLSVIELHYNHLSGPVPELLATLSNLTVLQLSNNMLEGVFPPIIFQLQKLTSISLTNNLGISGKLPNFSAHSYLQSISVSNTNFSGTIPASISNLKYLKELALGASGFSGMLPSSIGEIQGAIPQWTWETWTMNFFLLNLSHNNFTSIGSNPLLPLYIEYFDLSFNNFDGAIPVPQKGSITLDYSTNRFSSMPLNFSSYLKSTVVLKASDNSLSGNIPSSICDAIKSLQLLDLSNNNLTGSMPSCLTQNASALQVLSLKQNHLTGELPDNIKEGCALSALDFSGNMIQGQLPRSLVACRNLEILDIGNNQISDHFPCWMSKLPELQVLVLKSNKFHGKIMDPLYTRDGNNCQFSMLRIADIASNNFSGTLPEELFKMLKSMMTRSDNETLVMEHQYSHGQTYQFTAALTYKGNDITISKILRSLVLIDVSNNEFDGSIPSSIGELALLHGLNMSHNMLTGPIPTQFDNLNNLESLDLSSNKLSGEIPQELASLNFLATLNLSYNMLAGRIPQSSHFSTFSNASFEGNIGLCGPPLSKQCSDRSEPNIMPHASKKDPIDVLLFLFTGLGFGVCFGITILVIWGSNNRKQQA